MRQILMTADAVGGVWTYAVDLARALGDRGIRVALAVMGPSPSDAQREEVAALPAVTLHHEPFRLEWMEDAWRDLKRAGEWLLDLERHLQPDVVHLNGYCHSSLPWRAPVMVVAHSCVLSWWAAVHGEDAPVEWDRYAERVSEGLFDADLVVAPTKAMLAALNFHYGPLRRSRVIPNGRDSRFGIPACAAASAGERDSEIAGREPLIFSSGRIWDPAKNLELLAGCARDLPWPVYVAGDTAHPNGGAVTLPDVTCLGRLSSRGVQAWMRRAPIYALPARYEPFGLSALEAAFAGCALVLGDIRSLREVWGGAALYVPTENRRALVSTLRRLIDDEELRAEMAARAALRAAALTADRMADGYGAAYQQLCASAAAVA